MFDPQRLIEQFLGGQSANNRAANNRAGGAPAQQSQFDLGGLARNAGLGGATGGALAGGLAALLLSNKKSRKFAGKAVKMGGMAVLGGLAFKAWQNWQAKQAGAAPPPFAADPAAAAEGTAFLPAPPQQRASVGLALVSAMIAAAKADGHIDAAEQKHIFGQLDNLALSAEEKAFVMDELRKPLDIDAVVSGASSPEVAAEIYLASRLAIDPDHPAERAYLAMLASRLALEPDLVEELDRQAVSAP